MGLFPFGNKFIIIQKKNDNKTKLVNSFLTQFEAKNGQKLEKETVAGFLIFLERERAPSL